MLKDIPIILAHELDRDEFRQNFLIYTRKAFLALPKIDNPSILDIGCGSGVPTLELAMLSNGVITGIDINESELNKLREKAIEQGLNHRIKTIQGSILKIGFPDNSFDIIWGEGISSFLNFEKSLRTLKRLIKSNGFLVLHDEARIVPTKLRKISKYGYILIEHFMLPEDTWWREYYGPLEKRIKNLRKKYKDNPAILQALITEQVGVDRIRDNPLESRSGFFIMQKQ